MLKFTDTNLVDFVNMDLQERKAAMIKRFERVQDLALIKAIEHMLGYAQNDHKRQESILEAHLDEAQKQIENGQLTPHAKVREKYKKWL